MNEYLDSTPSLSKSYFMRMFVLGAIDALVILPLGIITLVLTLRREPISLFWRRWTPETTLSTVKVVLASSWTPSIWDNFGVRWDQWINVLFSLVFFFLFGFNSRTKERYSRIFWRICRLSGRDPRPNSTISIVRFRGVEKSPQNVSTLANRSSFGTIDISSQNISTLRRSQYNIP